SEGKNDICAARIWRRRVRLVVEEIRAAAGEHGEIGRHASRSGLEKQVIGLSRESNSLRVAHAEPQKALSRGEGNVDLIADIASEPINGISAVGDHADPRV